MTENSEYVPPKVWTWEQPNGGTFASTNRPIAGATHDAELPRGKHPFQLYSMGTPNGVKVTVMFEELLTAGHAGAEYDAWLISIGKGDQFGSGFVDINPNSKIPALVDYSGDAPLRVFESGSILVHLAEKFGAFLPTDLAARTECMNWLFWQMGSAPYLGGGFGHFYAYAPYKMEYPIDRFSMEVKRQLDVLDRQLAENPFVAGDEYTIADMAIWSWASLWRRQEQTLDDKPNFSRWLETVKQRPGVQAGRALEAARRTTQLEEDREAQNLLFRQT